MGEKATKPHKAVAPVDMARTVAIDRDGVDSEDESQFLETKEGRGAGRLWELEPGISVGRYVIVSRLGSGGMGVVYSAHDPELDRRVAIKVLRAATSGGASDGKARLLREAQAMAKLSHPNVVGVYDVGTHGDRVYLAMEFVDGTTLKEWVTEAAPTQAELLVALNEAGRGLAAAHAAGFVHRDLKPDNILIAKARGERPSRALVVDFGLARAAGPAESITGDRRGGEATCGASLHSHHSFDVLVSPLTQDGVVVGTPAYMAPEQHLGRPPDAATDQYSFCVTMFEVLFGRRPFGGKSLRELAKSKVQFELQEVQEGARVPDRLRRVIVRGLNPDPRNRYSSMLALLDAMELATRPVRRRLVPVAAGGAVLVLAGIATAASIGNSPGGLADSCEDAQGRLSGIWDEQRKLDVEQAFAATDREFAADSWVRVERWLDAYAASWVTSYADACRATHVAGEQTESVLDLRMRCLESRRASLRATVDTFAEADVEIVQRAISQVTALASVDRCRDVDALRADIEPPTDPQVAARVEDIRVRMEEALAAERGGRFAHSEKLATVLLEEVQALGYPPINAEVWVRLGGAQHSMGKVESAADSYAQAHQVATESGHDAAAADAATRMVFLYAEDFSDTDTAMKWARHAEAGLARHGDADSHDGRLARARLLSNIGIVHSSMGRYDEAYQNFSETLEAKRALLGDEHPEVAGALENTGLALVGLGRFEEARDLTQEANDIFRRVLGDAHPDVALSLINLGNIVDRLGDHERSWMLYSEALEISENALGAEHPMTASALDNLGMVAGRAGRYDEALKYHQRAMDVVLKAFGPDHRQLAWCHGNLGSTYALTNRHEDARREFERTLEILLATVGEEHDFTAATYNNLGMTLVDLERYDEAEVMLERGLDIRKRTLGLDHMDVASSHNGIAVLHGEQGKWAEARKHHEDALAILEARLGRNHPETAATWLDLGYVAGELGEHEKSQAAYEHVIEAIGGRDDLGTAFLADARFGLAQALVQQRRDRPRARELAAQALAGFQDAGDTYEDAVDDVTTWQRKYGKR